MPVRCSLLSADRDVLEVGSAPRVARHRARRRLLQPAPAGLRRRAGSTRLHWRAVMPQTVFLDDLPEPEVAALIQGGLDTPLGPTGSTERHGPHGPMGTDVIIPREVCRRVAERRGALVAPPLPYGLAAGHRGFAGLAY